MTSGRPTSSTTTTSPVYVEAAPDVVVEVCAPVWVDGQTVGAINIESTTRSPWRRWPTPRRFSEALGRRVTELGGVPHLTAGVSWRTWPRGCKRSTDPVVVSRSLLDAVVRLSGNDSAALVLGTRTRGS